MQELSENNLKNAPAEEVAKEAVRVLLERKALDVRLYAVADVTSVTEFYVNASGRSTTQTASLADELLRKLGERGRNALRVEGRQGNTWLLVDYGDVIINVFEPKTRDFYQFDRHLPTECARDISALVHEVDEKYRIETKDE